MKAQALQSAIGVQARPASTTLISSKVTANLKLESQPASSNAYIPDSAAEHGKSSDAKSSSVEADTNSQELQAPDAVSPSKLEVNLYDTNIADSTSNSSKKTISIVMTKAA